MRERYGSRENTETATATLTRGTQEDTRKGQEMDDNTKPEAAQHTPEKWRVYENGDGETEILAQSTDGHEYTVATMEKTYARHAAAIVRDHNAAPGLTHALEWLVEAVVTEDKGSTEGALTAARAALAAAQVPA